MCFILSLSYIRQVWWFRFHGCCSSASFHVHRIEYSKSPPFFKEGSGRFVNCKFILGRYSLSNEDDTNIIPSLWGLVGIASRMPWQSLTYRDGTFFSLPLVGDSSCCRNDGKYDGFVFMGAVHLLYFLRIAIFPALQVWKIFNEWKSLWCGENKLRLCFLLVIYLS